MKTRHARRSPIVALAVAAASVALAAQYAADPQWLKLPEGRTEIGSMHGDVAVSSSGELDISVEGSVRQRFAILGQNPGLQVYAPDGRFLRNVEQAPSDLHGSPSTRASHRRGCCSRIAKTDGSYISRSTAS